MTPLERHKMGKSAGFRDDGLSPWLQDSGIFENDALLAPSLASYLNAWTDDNFWTMVSLLSCSRHGVGPWAHAAFQSQALGYSAAKALARLG